MKKRILLIFVATALLSTNFTACGSGEKKTEAPLETAKEQYQCPMKCTEEILDKPGTCTVCGMELEKITKS